MAWVDCGAGDTWAVLWVASFRGVKMSFSKIILVKTMGTYEFIHDGE